MSRCGFVTVAVLDADADGAPAMDVDAVLTQAMPLDDPTAPAGLERYAEAIDGSSAGLTTEEETTVDRGECASRAGAA